MKRGLVNTGSQEPPSKICNVVTSAQLTRSETIKENVGAGVVEVLNQSFQRVSTNELEDDYAKVKALGELKVLSNLLFEDNNKTLSKFVSGQKLSSIPYCETDCRSRLELKLIAEMGQNQEFAKFKRVCAKLRAEISETIKEQRQLSDVELWEKAMGELKKARSRETATGSSSIYVLLDLPADADASSVSSDECKDGILYSGISKDVTGRRRSHISATKLHFRRLIPLNHKEARIMDILDNKRQLVAFYCDELTGNEALASEYGIVTDLKNVLTNIDGSGESNDVMFKKHPETIKRISEIALNKPILLLNVFSK
uniref:Kinesin motor domain-containing protein n=1 Tax=Rhabditophanes sp. KR3021 TaxID=114890 RepID=A0AC35UIK8_9BILA